LFTLHLPCSVDRRSTWQFTRVTEARVAATETQQFTIAQRVAAEAIGTSMLLAAVVGSGIMGERLAGGNIAIALLANTIATGAALVALILTFGPISGAHFNPAVTLADASQGGVAWTDVPAYLAAQIAGAFAGVATAHAMFELPVYVASKHARTGAAQAFSEFVATFGLLAVIWGCARLRSTAVPFAVAATSRPPTGSRHRPRSRTQP
jgi:glycerol uptake facilitator-like aquaporin